MIRSWCVVAAMPLLFACSSKAPTRGPEPTPPTTTPTPTPTPVAAAVVELASVTLADDCGDNGGSPPLPPPASQVAPSPGVVPVAPARCAGADCNRYRRACEQTSMQLGLAIAAGAPAATFAVKRVELLDEHGASLGDLTARNPSAWSDAAASYQPWDQALAPGAKTTASYALSAPDWSQLDGGRWSAHTKQFQLRVTVTVGTTDRTIEKQAIAPARLEPPVPT